GASRRVAQVRDGVAALRSGPALRDEEELHPRAPREHAHAAAVAGRVRVVAGDADEQVGATVAVHVARAGDREAELVARCLSFPALHQSLAHSIEDLCGPAHEARDRALRLADDDVRAPVARDVARTADGPAELVAQERAEQRVEL